MTREEFDSEIAKAGAFRKVFEWLKRRKRNYVFAFRTPEGEAVLADLASFCRANESCAALSQDGKVDLQRTLIAEGRREVWLRIQHHLNLTSEQLMLLYQSKSITGGEPQ